jgi:hypothetical protein
MIHNAAKFYSNDLDSQTGKFEAELSCLKGNDYVKAI